MSELDLQEAFRQLALDLDAVNEDDPELGEFELKRNGKEVHVEFRAYKGALSIRVTDPGDKKRPQATLKGLNAVDRLGRSMGVDEKLDIDDERFLESFDVETEAPSEAIAAMFRSKAVREAAFELQALGALPVWINEESVGMSEDAGVKDLAHERIDGIITALCRFEDALGTWDETVDRSPIRKKGRRVIRKTPRPSKTGELLDWTPLAALFSLPFSIIVWMLPPGYALEKHTSVLVGMAGLISVIVATLSLRALRGQKRALLRVIGRTIGVTVLLSHVLFFLLHLYNRSGGPSKVEYVTVVAREPPHAKSSGWTELTRTGDPTIYRISSGWRTEVGKPLRMTIHEGRLGWAWCEYAD